jgi:hypothetical protein
MTAQISYRASDGNILIAVGSPLRAVFWESNSGPESHRNRVKVVWSGSEWFELLHSPVPEEELRQALLSLVPEGTEKRQVSILVTFLPETVETILFDWQNLNYRYLFPLFSVEKVFRRALTPILHLALEMGLGPFGHWEWVWDSAPRQQAEVTEDG